MLEAIRELMKIIPYTGTHTMEIYPAEKGAVDFFTRNSEVTVEYSKVLKVLQIHFQDDIHLTDSVIVQTNGWNQFGTVFPDKHKIIVDGCELTDRNIIVIELANNGVVELGRIEFSL